MYKCKLSLPLWHFLESKTKTSVTGGLKPNFSESSSVKRKLNHLLQFLLWGGKTHKSNVVSGLSYLRNYSFNAPLLSHPVGLVYFSVI